MKKILLSSAFICIFTAINAQVFAQEKTNKTTTNSSQETSSPITVNQQVGSWQLHCAYPNNEQSKQKNTSQGCIAQQSLMVTGKDNKQTPVASLLLEKIRNNQNPSKVNPIQFTVVTPLGFSLQQPVTISIEHAGKTDLPWITCTTNGCIASQPINSALQKSLETNKTAQLIIHRVNKTTVTINFNIEDLHNVFTAMNDLINKKAP